MVTSTEDPYASLPPELVVQEDGPVRVITLNRPEALNAVNWELDLALSFVFDLISDDRAARAAVVTGAGRAFCAGGDLAHIELMRQDQEVRRASLRNGKRLIQSMLRCRVPVVAAVNGPAVGLGCSILAFADMVFMGETAHLADPHVAVGLVAGDGGPLGWPAHVSLLLAKEHLLTGDPVAAQRAAQIGLANHVVADDAVVEAAVAWAHRVSAMPQQAVEETKRLLNLRLERDVVSSVDFAFAAEDRSFDTEDLRANVARFLERRRSNA